MGHDSAVVQHLTEPKSDLGDLLGAHVPIHIKGQVTAAGAKKTRFHSLSLSFSLSLSLSLS